MSIKNPPLYIENRGGSGLHRKAFIDMLGFILVIVAFSVTLINFFSLYDV